jgi:hypothetical protein
MMIALMSNVVEAMSVHAVSRNRDALQVDGAVANDILEGETVATANYTNCAGPGIHYR